MNVNSPEWRDDTVFLWDNAPYHRSMEVKEVLKRLGVKVIYTGPYSYSGVPIELLFSGLKLGDLNPQKQPTGKR